jgi:hypothetical protein
MRAAVCVLICVDAATFSPQIHIAKTTTLSTRHHTPQSNHNLTTSAAAVRPDAPVAETLHVTGPHLTEFGVKALHNLSMDAELCGVELRGPGGRVSYAYKLGEWCVLRVEG